MLEHQKAQRAHSSSVPSESTKRRIYPASSDGSMGPSTRLWNRLRDIPNNPNDPECVKELVIVAFGAFERYYICWKIQNGEYRQDSYGLPDELQTWLFPPDGSTRDFDTLQIVFGHGDEYFASDKNGKVSNRDSTADLKDKLSARQVPPRQNLRRSHTLSMTSLPSERELRPPSLAPATQSPPTRSIRRRDTLRAARPQSIAIDGSSFWSWLEKKTERESQAQVADTRPRHIAPPAAILQPPNPKRVCRYVDAGVQTEPDQDDLESTSTRSTRSRSSSTYSMQRMSTSPLSIFGTIIDDPANPVIMGSYHEVHYQLSGNLGNVVMTSEDLQPQKLKRVQTMQVGAGLRRKDTFLAGLRHVYRLAGTSQDPESREGPGISRPTAPTALKTI